MKNTYTVGRPAINDYDGIVKRLQELYADRKATSAGQIAQEHPELAGPVKSLMNHAKEQIYRDMHLAPLLAAGQGADG